MAMARVMRRRSQGASRILRKPSITICPASVAVTVELMPQHKSATPNSVGAMSDTAMRNVRVLVAASNGCGGRSTRSMLRKIGRTSSMSRSANGLGVMRPPTLINSGSPTCSRSRANA